MLKPPGPSRPSGDGEDPGWEGDDLDLSEADADADPDPDADADPEADWPEAELSDADWRDADPDADPEVDEYDDEYDADPGEDRAGEPTQAYARFDDTYDYDDGPPPQPPSSYQDDDLDDGPVRPYTPRPIPPSRGGGRPPGPPRAPRAVVLKQRRRRRRFVIGLTFFLSVTVTLVGSGFVYLQYRLDQIPRVDVPSLSEDRPGGVMNVLLVGSDSRERLEGTDALQAGKGSVSGQRSDTIMVLHIDPQQEQAAILSIPRDLYVPIAGEGYSDRINAAFALGGAQGLSETIQQSLGITINHYVEVDFVGFKDIVDAVGGVQLYIPAWVRDFTSGLDIHEIGCVEVDGTQGLAWVRSRNFEILQADGLTWATDPRADLGRIERQQDFIRRMLKKALSSGITNPIQLNRLIGIGVRDVTLDETLSTKDLTTLARRFNDLDPNSVALLTLPTAPADIEGSSVLELREGEAQPYLDRLNGIAGTPLPVPGAGSPAAPTTTVAPDSLLYPEDVDIEVLNGEGTPGAAADAALALESAGFTVSGTGDSTEIRRTTIRHGAGALGAAQLLDRALLGGADLIVDEDVTDTDVVLVIGADYQGLTAGPVTPIPQPSTTVTTRPTGSGSTTTTFGATTSTAPPTTLGPTTLPPGEEC